LDTIDEAQAENIFTREQLLRYFPYYLLVNSTFAVTAALGAAGLDSEANLMARVRTLLAEVRDQVTHKTCLNYVLESPYWNVKGNFFCYLNDHNENTIVDPSVIYFDFANPLQAQEV
ncbi:ferric iron reductase, partial [Escherichia coli]